MPPSKKSTLNGVKGAKVAKSGRSVQAVARAKTTTSINLTINMAPPYAVATTAAKAKPQKQAAPRQQKQTVAKPPPPVRKVATPKPKNTPSKAVARKQAGPKKVTEVKKQVKTEVKKQVKTEVTRKWVW